MAQPGGALVRGPDGKQLRRGVFRGTRELEQAIERYIDHHNAAPKPFVWTKTADQILTTIGRFCKRNL